MGMGKSFTNISVAKISSLEHRLSGTLKPITPRREFVNHLGQRIQYGERPTFVNNVANWHIIAIIVAALASLSVIIAMVMRVLLLNSEKKRPA